MALPKCDLRAAGQAIRVKMLLVFCRFRTFPTKTSIGMRPVSCATNAVCHSWTNSSGRRRTRFTVAIATMPSLPPAVMVAAKSLELVSVTTVLSLIIASQRQFGIYNTYVLRVLNR